MINLISKEDRAIKKMARISSWSKWLTTLVLLIYVVAMVGLSSWWWDIANREQEQTDEEKQLVENLKKLADTEVLARQLDTRAKIVQQTVAGRKEVAPKLGKMLGQMSGLVLVDWGYAQSGEQTLTVRTDSAPEAENFVNRVKDAYKYIKLNGLRRGDEALWEVKFTVSDGL